MLRVKSAEVSLQFYRNVMGMTLMRTSENTNAGFNLYFLGYPGGEGVPAASANGVNLGAHREGLLELTWNYGTGISSTESPPRIPILPFWLQNAL